MRNAQRQSESRCSTDPEPRKQARSMLFAEWGARLASAQAAGRPLSLAPALVTQQLLNGISPAHSTVDLLVLNLVVTYGATSLRTSKSTVENQSGVTLTACHTKCGLCHDSSLCDAYGVSMLRRQST